MNSNLEKMKNALLNYRAEREKVLTKVEQAKELYGEEAAYRENERLMKGLRATRATAEAQIQDAFAAGLEWATKWGRMDGKQITDDVKLFDAGIVTPEVFEDLKKRYYDNATMLQVLKFKGEELNEAHARQNGLDGNLPLGEPYNVRDIITPRDRTQAFEQAKKEAMSLLDGLDGRGTYQDPYTQAMWGQMGNSVIDRFGEGYPV